MASLILTCRKFRGNSYFAVFIVVSFLLIISEEGNNVKADSSQDQEYLYPTVVIATLVRNKEHTLPWFLGLIEKLDYPKDRIALWIHSDHNVDNSSAILREWLAGVSSDSYHKLEVNIDEENIGFPGEESPCDWTKERFTHVIQLRQKALDYARDIWADYFFMLDADVNLENPLTLQKLMHEEKFIIAPMLNCSMEAFYSNFWGDMTEQGFYKRSENYMSIMNREVMGAFPVPMVHTVFLINLHHVLALHIAYTPPKGYTGPYDDIIIFALTLKSLGHTMHVLNSDYFGKVLVPMSKTNTLKDDHDHFTYVKLEAMVEEVPELYKSPHIHVPEIPKTKLGFDEVYMINLKRRPSRRYRMLKAFDYLGIDAKVVDAVDGKQLNDSYLDELGIKMLPGFADPYHGRPMTMGEIGCFLSHYFIWEEIVARKLEKVVVFEDDVRFQPFFKYKLQRMMDDVNRLFDSWDLIYLGRKRLEKDTESMVQGSEHLSWPRYTYWTISYLLSYRGAKKLLDQNPLTKMVPVDEYLPILFDKHPEDSWRFKFYPRDLMALSAEPFILYPTHYTGEPHYFSDTEDSVVIEKGETIETEKVMNDESGDEVLQDVTKEESTSSLLGDEDGSSVEEPDTNFSLGASGGASGSWQSGKDEL